VCSNIFNFFDKAYFAIPLTNLRGLIAKPGLYEKAPYCSVPPCPISLNSSFE
jgi:hypothetical protein